MIKSLYPHIKLITAAIDTFEWKHSWHLPKDSLGYTTWDKHTAIKCIKILNDHRNWCARKMRELDAALAVCTEYVKYVESIEGDESADQFSDLAKASINNGGVPVYERCG